MGDPESTFAPVPGRLETVAPGIRRILAPNPSAMTFLGTNTYVIGSGSLAVIDPGPDDSDHLRAIMGSVGASERITAVFVTHSHRDHSPLARPLSRVTGAPVLAFGPSEAGRSPIMTRLAAEGLAGGGEGVDRAFQPDRRLHDGETLDISGQLLTAIATPGHMGNHMAFAWGNALFCGDLVMGWSSTLVSPPDGDLTDFYASCARLQTRSEALFLPGHGAPLHDPQARIEWLLRHRRERDTQIRAAISGRPSTATEVAARVYTDIDATLLPAAARNVLAHLIALHQAGAVSAEPALSATARFALNATSD